MEKQKKEVSLLNKPMNEYTLADSLKVQGYIVGAGLGLVVLTTVVGVVVGKIMDDRAFRKLDRKAAEEK